MRHINITRYFYFRPNQWLSKRGRARKNSVSNLIRARCAKFTLSLPLHSWFLRQRSSIPTWSTGGHSLHLVSTHQPSLLWSLWRRCSRAACGPISRIRSKNAFKGRWTSIFQPLLGPFTRSFRFRSAVLLYDINYLLQVTGSNAPPCYIHAVVLWRWVHAMLLQVHRESALNMVFSSIQPQTTRICCVEDFPRMNQSRRLGGWAVAVAW